jgi:hypothetical protein
VLVVALAGCQNTPKNQGSAGGRIDPTSDAKSEEGSTDLRSADLVNSTDRMAADIAQRLDINNRASPPVIVAGPMENATSRAEQNYQIFLERLRAQLLSAGTRHGLVFVRERAFVEQARDTEFGGKDPNATAEAYRSSADYLLTGKVSDLPSGDTNYYLVSFQLVQLRGARSGPDIGSGAIVWENMYEVKYR